MSGQEGLKKEYRKDLLVQKLIEALNGALGGSLWGVVLFGSQARREGKVVSDWDVFNLADGVSDNPVERTISFQNILFKSGEGKRSWHGRYYGMKAAIVHDDLNKGAGQNG